jgi:aminopeptidase N
VKEVDADMLAEYSADSSITFLPLRIRDNQVLDPFGNSMENTLFLLPVTAMVLAAEDIELDAEPEEGTAGEMAETLDTLDDARKIAQAAAKEAAEATEAAENAKKKVADLTADSEGIDEEIKAKAEKAAEEAQKQAAKLTRKAAKAAAKAETAAREAEASGAIQEDSEP